MPLVPSNRPESVRLTSAADAGDAVRAAAAGGWAVELVGGGTQSYRGGPLSRPVQRLDLRGLNRLVDYPARDLTITVEAGVTVAQLSQWLAAERQWLPVDLPCAATATLGGSVAADVSGIHRGAYGTLRDALIGITFVGDTGELIHAGGRVVKNVAGYDLMKLHTGALGTLGVLTQLTFKVRPLPEVRAVLSLGVPAADLPAVLATLHGSRSRPAVAEVVTSAAWKAVGGTAYPLGIDYVIVTAFEESATAVVWQREAFRSEFHHYELRDESAAVLRALTDTLPASPSLAIKRVRPSRLAETLRKLPSMPLLQASAATGHIRVATDTLPPGFRWEKPPPGQLWQSGLTTDDPAARLMRRLKEQLDPADIFNPGRLFDPTAGANV